MVNCDKIGHKLLTEPKIIDQIVDTFGDKVLSKDTNERVIDRRALGTIVFSDENEMNKLNQIMWNEIRNQYETIIDKTKKNDVDNENDNILMVIEAAILVEAKWHLLSENSFDEIWISQVPRQAAIKRIVERNGWTVEKASNAIDRQLSNQERINIVQNDCDKHVAVITCDKPTVKDLEKEIDQQMNALYHRYPKFGK